MRRCTGALIAICFLSSTLISCTTAGLIADQESIKLQKQLHRYRTGINIAEVGLVFASSFGEMLTGVTIYPTTHPQSFKKFTLVNPSLDTLFINMVTDRIWKNNTYCDIKNMVLLPQHAVRVIVPNHTAYNIYYRSNYYAPDDEKREINTGEIRILKLYPKMIEDSPLEINH